MPQGEKKDISKETTVIFVDWDDTLLCSSFLSGAGYRLDSVMEGTSTLYQELKDLETSVISLLRLAMSFGDVHVVTNAETGWVQLSAKKFLPGVVPLLDRVKVLSARSTYESMFPDSPVKWKFCAFQERLNADSKSPKNVISFGDSHVEREAIRAVTRGLSNTKTKSVKFAEKPSLEQLRRQLELVVNCFQYIHGHESDLDLQLTVTVNKKSPDTNTAETGEGTSNTNSKSKEEGKQATPCPAPADPQPALKP
jgi:hypothetical protein